MSRLALKWSHKRPRIAEQIIIKGAEINHLEGLFGGGGGGGLGVIGRLIDQFGEEGLAIIFGLDVELVRCA